MLRRNFLKCMSVSPLLTLYNNKEEKRKKGLPETGSKYPFRYKLIRTSKYFLFEPTMTLHHEVRLNIFQVQSMVPIYTRLESLSSNLPDPKKDVEVFYTNLDHMDFQKLSKEVMCYHGPSKRLITGIHWEKINANS